MRLKLQHARPQADTASPVKCPHCGVPTQDAGRMGAWLFFSCVACQLVWRLTPAEYLTISRDPSRLPEAC